MGSTSGCSSGSVSLCLLPDRSFLKSERPNFLSISRALGGTPGILVSGVEVVKVKECEVGKKCDDGYVLVNYFCVVRRRVGKVESRKCQ